MPSPSPASTRRGFDPLEILVEASDIAAGHTLNLDELLQALADLIRKVIDYQLFAVLLSTEKGDALRIRFSIGYGDEVVRSLRIQIGEGISGTAAQQRKPVIVNDVSRDSRYIAAVDNVRSEMAVPLIARGKIVGVIDLQSPELNAFSDHERGRPRDSATIACSNRNDCISLAFAQLTAVIYLTTGTNKKTATNGN